MGAVYWLYLCASCGQSESLSCGIVVFASFLIHRWACLPHYLVDSWLLSWHNSLVETWRDKAHGTEDIEFTIVHPPTEDAAVGINSAAYRHIETVTRFSFFHCFSLRFGGRSERAPYTGYRFCCAMPNQFGKPLQSFAPTNRLPTRHHSEPLQFVVW